jgi:hypothetical protein
MSLVGVELNSIAAAGWACKANTTKELAMAAPMRAMPVEDLRPGMIGQKIEGCAIT